MGGGGAVPRHWEVEQQLTACTSPHHCPTTSCLQLSPSPHHLGLPDSQESGSARWESPRPPHILSAPLLVISPHLQSLLCPSSPYTPFLSGPVLSPLPLPAPLPACLSARLQLGDNLPHLASRLLPRLIAQLVPGDRPSFFPTPIPSLAPKLPPSFPCFPHPLPVDQLPPAVSIMAKCGWPGLELGVSIKRGDCEL